MHRFPTSLLVVALLLTVALPAAAELPSLPGPDDPIDVDSLGRAAQVLTGLVEPADEDLTRAAADLAAGGEVMGACLLALRHRFSRPEHIEVSVRALEQLGSGKIESYLHFQLGTSRDPEVRRTAYRLLVGRSGPEGLLPLLAALKDDAPEVGRIGEETLASLLRDAPGREPHATVEKQLPHLPWETRWRVLSAVADADRPEGLTLLTRQLGRDSSLDDVILSGIARMDADGADAALGTAVAKVAESGNRMIRKLATTVLGRIEDPGTVPALIDLLGSSEEGLRRDAYWALRRISGMEFPEDAARWRAWYEREMAWWWTEGQQLLEDLHSLDDRIAVRAIRLLTRRPFFRRAVEGEFLALTERGTPVTRRFAGDALGRLGLREDPSGEGQTALASARFLDPSARPEEVVHKKSAPPIHIRPGAGVPVPLLILGGLTILYLLWRICGRAVLARVVGFGRWVVNPGRHEGPITTTIERRPRR